MRTPQNLADAKAIYREEKTKFTHALSVVAGSRWLTAITAALAISFGSTWAFAPDRLPHLSGISLGSFGLPGNLDFGVVGEQVGQAGAAAVRQGAGEAATGFFAAHAAWIPIINGIGFFVFFAALIGNLWIMTLRRRYTRG